MRIIDWSSDVCSSDLERTNPRLGEIDRLLFLERAQPLDPAFPPEPRLLEPAIGKRAIDDHRILGDIARAQLPSDAPHRSEERRVGKECVSTCRSRGSPKH